MKLHSEIIPVIVLAAVFTACAAPKTGVPQVAITSPVSTNVAVTSSAPVINIQVPANISFLYVRGNDLRPEKLTEKQINYLKNSKLMPGGLLDVNASFGHGRYAVYQDENLDVLVCDMDIGSVKRVQRDFPYQSDYFAIYNRVIWTTDDYFALEGDYYDNSYREGGAWSGKTPSGKCYALCDAAGLILDFLQVPTVYPGADDTTQ